MEARPMTKSFLRCSVVMLASGFWGAHAADPAITVYVYDYSEIPADVLTRAKSAAIEIYRRAGVETEWLDCPTSAADLHQNRACRQRPGASRLVMKIVPPSMAERMGLDATTYGISWIPDDGSFGWMAFVCSQRASRLAKGNPQLEGVLLGHLMAHEIGHLLLGANSHAASGIMKVPWAKKEVRLAQQGRMGFTPKQALHIQSEAVERASTKPGRRFRLTLVRPARWRNA